MPRVLVSLSGGKDSVLAVQRAMQRYERNEVGLHVLVHPDADGTERIRFHRVPLELVMQQAESLGLPLRLTRVEDQSSNEAFEQAILADWAKWKKQDQLHTLVFGDVHLEDVIDYKSTLCERAGLNVAFPLSGVRPLDLADEFVHVGGIAVVCLAQGAQLPKGTAGRTYDAEFLTTLPDGVDPVGEGGEFHTFVTHFPPQFSHPVLVKVGRLHDDHWQNGQAYEWVELATARQAVS
jgi:uncharacterized protein (TIGR00290 family)